MPTTKTARAEAGSKRRGTQVLVPAGLARLLKAQAAYEDRTQQDIVARVLTNYLESKEAAACRK